MAFNHLENSDWHRFQSAYTRHLNPQWCAAPLRELWILQPAQGRLCHVSGNDCSSRSRLRWRHRRSDGDSAPAGL